MNRCNQLNHWLPPLPLPLLMPLPMLPMKHRWRKMLLVRLLPPSWWLFPKCFWLTTAIFLSKIAIRWATSKIIGSLDAFAVASWFKDLGSIPKSVANDTLPLFQLAGMTACLNHYGTKKNKVPYYGETGLNAGIMHMDLAK